MPQFVVENPSNPFPNWILTVFIHAFVHCFIDFLFDVYLLLIATTFDVLDFHRTNRFQSTQHSSISENRFLLFPFIYKHKAHVISCIERRTLPFNKHILSVLFRFSFSIRSLGQDDEIVETTNAIRLTPIEWQTFSYSYSHTEVHVYD